MNCPVCHSGLNMMERQGVEIDYCPKCRGVWLDRGELDKIIERSVTGAGQTRTEQYNQPRTDQYSQHAHQQEHYSNTSSHNTRPHQKHKKHESFLSELFDFD